MNSIPATYSIWPVFAPLLNSNMQLTVKYVRLNMPNMGNTMHSYSDC